MERTLAIGEKDRTDRLQLSATIDFGFDKLSVGSIVIQRTSRLADLWKLHVEFFEG